MFKITRNINKLSYLLHKRHYSLPSFQFLNLENTQKGYSILKMRRKPVNSFNLELISEMMQAIEYVENLPDCNGLIITSDLKVFSAGLDLFELYNMQRKKDENRMRTFLTLIQEFGLRLYQSPLVTIAALNGATPAGGCAISLSCDYRIMVDCDIKIGLNETLVGLTVPLSVCKLYSSLIGNRESEKHLSLGSLFTPHEALKLGLIDAVVSSEMLMPTVENLMEKSLSVPDIGRIACKRLMRGAHINDEGSEEYMEWITGALQNKDVQKIIGDYIRYLQTQKS